MTYLVQKSLGYIHTALSLTNKISVLYNIKKGLSYLLLLQIFFFFSFFFGGHHFTVLFSQSIGLCLENNYEIYVVNLPYCLYSSTVVNDLY